MKFDQAAVGGKTGINYMTEFEFYKRTLLDGKQKNPSWFGTILEEWNCEIFPQQPGDPSPDVEGEVIDLGDSNEIAQLMNKMHMESMTNDQAPVSATTVTDTEDDIDDIYDLGPPPISLVTNMVSTDNGLSRDPTAIVAAPTATVAAPMATVAAPESDLIILPNNKAPIKPRPIKGVQKKKVAAVDQAGLVDQTGVVDSRRRTTRTAARR